MLTSIDARQVLHQGGRKADHADDVAYLDVLQVALVRGLRVPSRAGGRLHLGRVVAAR